MFSQMFNVSGPLSSLEREFIKTTSNRLRERLFERLDNLSVLDTLDFSDQMWDQLYELSDGEFDEFCTKLGQCSSLGLVYLSANTAYKNPRRFIILVNTLAELKNIEIYLSYNEDDKATDSVQELGEALSQLPIKRLHIEVSKGSIHPTFGKYIARCPIESLSLKYSSIAPAPNRFSFLEALLAQHDRVFRGQAQTVRSLRIICDMASRSEIEALSSALANHGKNLKRLYLASSEGLRFTAYADDNFFNSLSTLQSLREINLDWNGMFMGSCLIDDFHSFFNALEQCPALHTLRLTKLYERGTVFFPTFFSTDETIPEHFYTTDPISKHSFNLLCSRLKELKTLTTLEIEQREEDLKKKTPRELVSKFLNLEQVLHAVGLSEAISGNLTIRTQILTSMFGDSYLEYYREYGRDAMFNTQYAALKAIVEENRTRLEPQQHSVQSPLTFSYSNNAETPTNENKPSKMRLKPSGI